MSPKYRKLMNNMLTNLFVLVTKFDITATQVFIRSSFLFVLSFCQFKWIYSRVFVCLCRSTSVRLEIMNVFAPVLSVWSFDSIRFLSPSPLSLMCACLYIQSSSICTYLLICILHFSSLFYVSSSLPVHIVIRLCWLVPSAVV
jgi:hypothetical protein